MSDISETIKSISKDLDFIGDIVVGSALKPKDTIKFGLPSLDAITGGVPRGLATEIYGNPSSGKSSLCLHLISEAQKQGIKCLYVDAEMAMTPDLMQMMGVDLDKIVIARPTNGEDAFELIEAFSEKDYGLIVVDSVSSLAPTVELENDYSQDTIALLARMMSRGMRKLTGLLHRKNVALVFINQIREKMAKMPGQKTTTTSGGRALGFYAGLRIEVARIKWIEDKDKNRIGMIVKAFTEKNKGGTPQRSAELEFMFGSGFNKGKDLLNHLVSIGDVKQVGLSYYLGDQNLGRKEEAISYLLENLKPVDKSGVDQS